MKSKLVRVYDILAWNLLLQELGVNLTFLNFTRYILLENEQPKTKKWSTSAYISNMIQYNEN